VLTLKGGTSSSTFMRLTVFLAGVFAGAKPDYPRS
jgi:hypothetical protein